MPIGKYFGGKGAGVLKSMEKTYGPDKGKQVFYATAQKEGQKPSADSDFKRRMHDAMDRMLDGRKK